MSERELHEENERLRRELADMTKSRERLREIVCNFLPVDRTEITEEEFADLVQRAKNVDDLLREILPREMHYIISEDQGTERK